MVRLDSRLLYSHLALENHIGIKFCIVTDFAWV